MKRLATLVLFLGLVFVRAVVHGDEPAKTRIVLIATKIDHPYATHMYMQECKLLAKCLNQTAGVEAVVCPTLDWPEDPRVFDKVKAIVLYSRPAGDILLGPKHRPQAQK